MEAVAGVAQLDSERILVEANAAHLLAVARRHAHDEEPFGGGSSRIHQSFAQVSRAAAGAHISQIGAATTALPAHDMTNCAPALRLINCLTFNWVSREFDRLGATER